ncbi:MAG: hypothetical protein ACRDZ4_20215 [Egibacteraceae bacterium]
MDPSAQRDGKFPHPLRERRMNRTLPPLAWWAFTRPITDDLGETLLRAAAELAGQTLNVLVSHELLRVRDIAAAEWLRPLGSPFVAAQATGSPAADITIAPAEKWGTRFPTEAIAGALVGFVEERQEYPAELRFRGTGIVHEPGGAARETDDLVRVLLLSTHDGLVVEVSTHTDVWLPYDLNARPQRELSDLNRPRLRAALEDLAVLAGGGVEFSENGKYAVVKGLDLRNHTNTFGQPVAVNWAPFEEA